MKRERIYLTVWAFAIVLVAGSMIFFRLHEPASRSGGAEPTVGPLVFAGLALMAFLCEGVDHALGMGYGTSLTPLLVTAGFFPLSVVPAALLSQLLGGALAGLLHHNCGNCDLRHSSPHSRILYVLAGFGIIGGVTAAFLLGHTPPFYVKLYIGLLVLGIGVFVWFSPRVSSRVSSRLSYKRIGGMGLLAAFNKGLTGGGYGPIVTGGQVLSGVNSKAAVGITAAAESITCVAALTALYFTGHHMNWALTAPLCLGALASTPLSVSVVKTLPLHWVQRAISLGCVMLGSMTLLNLIH
jgi:uncharacterized membrane protein YfcA